jgi:ubiquinone/menaquinone biosynthesis C-methylase UbiE
MNDFSPDLGVKIASFKKRDAASYDKWAEIYDRHISRLALPLAHHICALAKLRKGDRALDVGCGSGVATREAARCVGPSGYVLGIDLSSGMIATAKRPKTPGVEYRVMDAESLELRDGSFDAVISLCAVMHFPTIATALAEMYRVLRPGGRLVVSFGDGRPLAFGHRLRHFGREALWAATQWIRPQLKAPNVWLKLVSDRLPCPSEAIETDWAGRQPHQRLIEEVRAAGFSDIVQDWRAHEIRFVSPDDWCEAQFAIVTAARRRLELSSPSVAQSLRQTMLDLARHENARGAMLRYPYGAFFVSAVRPLNDDAVVKESIANLPEVAAAELQSGSNALEEDAALLHLQASGDHSE